MKKKIILILNGPNLNLTGKREIEIYGNTDFNQFLCQLKKNYPCFKIIYEQSHEEHKLIQILTSSQNIDGIIFNPGAYTHTSVAIADAIRSLIVPVIEVHISQVFNREDFRKQSYITPVCIGSICGFGLQSYRMAIEYFK